MTVGPSLCDISARLPQSKKRQSSCLLRARPTADGPRARGKHERNRKRRAGRWLRVIVQVVAVTCRGA